MAPFARQFVSMGLADAAASATAAPAAIALPDTADTVAMLAFVKTRLTALVVVAGLVLLALAWQIVMGVIAHRQTWEYAIEAPTDDDLSKRLLELGVGGWEIVSARRATTEIGGRPKASYEMILRRPH
jgi:hypothetical protein